MNVVQVKEEFNKRANKHVNFANKNCVNNISTFTQLIWENKRYAVCIVFLSTLIVIELNCNDPIKQ